MATLLYHSADPVNNKSSYSELENVQFNIEQNGRKLVLGSLRLEGDLLVKSDVNRCNNTVTHDELHFNRRAGAHCLVESFQVETAAMGTIETLASDYARYINMAGCGSKSNSDYNNAADVCELKASSDAFTNAMCCGVRYIGTATNVYSDIDFSFKPQVCLNRNIEGVALAFRKSGFIKLTFNLARNLSMLWGNTVNPNFEVSNLRLTYRTIPDDGQDDVIVCRSLLSLKSTVDSNYANVSSSVPAFCDAVSISFQKVANENSVNLDNQRLENLPGFNSIQYMFNDSNNNYISYIIDSVDEVLSRGSESFLNTGHSGYSAQTLKGNNGFLAGISFDKMVNLSNQNFNIQLDCQNMAQEGPYSCYQIYHSVVNL